MGVSDYAELVCGDRRGRILYGLKDAEVSEKLDFITETICVNDVPRPINLGDVRAGPGKHCC